MSWNHITRESHDALQRLKHEARATGDETFSVLLSGLDLYISLGREFELIEHMRHFAEEMRDSVENTPTAADLERLYRAEDAE